MEIVFSFEITIQLNIYNIKVSTISQQIMLLVDGQTAHLFSACSIENRPRSRSGDYPPPSVGGKTRGEREMWYLSLLIKSLVCLSDPQSVHQMPSLIIRCLVCRSYALSVDQIPSLQIRCLFCSSNAQSVDQMPSLFIKCLVCRSDAQSVFQILCLFIRSLVFT